MPRKHMKEEGENVKKILEGEEHSYHTSVDGDNE